MGGQLHALHSVEEAVSRHGIKGARQVKGDLDSSYQDFGGIPCKAIMQCTMLCLAPGTHLKAVIKDTAQGVFMGASWGIPILRVLHGESIDKCLMGRKSNALCQSCRKELVHGIDATPLIKSQSRCWDASHLSRSAYCY